MTRVRSVARIGGRSAATLVAAALTAAAFAAAALVPWPDHRVAPVSTVVQPAESRQQRVCPGPLLTLADDAAAATTASSIGRAATTTAVDPADAELQHGDLESPGNPNAHRDGHPATIAAAPGAVAAGMLAGAQSQVAATETVGGLAVAGCEEAVNDAWIVAGATDLGRTSLLFISNPSDVAATVDVTIDAESGAVAAPAGRGVVVPARTQRVLSLAGLAPDASSPVVHVTSTGGPVAVALEQTVIDGLKPDGVELTGPTTAPATSQIVPGVLVPQASGAAVVNEVEGDAPPVVRLLAPGNRPANVSIAIIPDSGGAGTVLQAQLQAGRVGDVPLGRLAAGAYTVKLSSDVPVVAAVRTTTTVQGEPLPSDFAWFTAARPLLDRAVIAVPAGPSPVLRMMNPGSDDLTVTMDGAGVPAKVTVRAGATTAVPLRADSSVKLRGAAGIVASVGFSGPRRLAAFGVQPPGPLDSPLTVSPR